MPQFHREVELVFVPFNYLVFSIVENYQRNYAGLSFHYKVNEQKSIVSRNFIRSPLFLSAFCLVRKKNHQRRKRPLQLQQHY
jgi:hypothetical protein